MEIEKKKVAAELAYVESEVFEKLSMEYGRIAKLLRKEPDMSPELKRMRLDRMKKIEAKINGSEPLAEPATTSPPSPANSQTSHHSEHASPAISDSDLD